MMASPARGVTSPKPPRREVRRGTLSYKFNTLAYNMFTMLNQDCGEANGEHRFALILLKNLDSEPRRISRRGRRGGFAGIDFIEEFAALARRSLKRERTDLRESVLSPLNSELGLTAFRKVNSPRAARGSVRPHTGERLRPVVGPALARRPSRWSLQGAGSVDDFGDLVGGEAVEDGFEANLFAGFFDPLVFLDAKGLS
jgi:hypothetical protein